jgi:phosphatidylinositol alpha-1,6-mannosyltransferase
VLARRGARVILFLIGVEVWRRLRSRERHAVASANGLIAISHATARRFRDANPDLAAVRVSVCLLGIRPAAARASGADGVDPAPLDGSAGFALIVGRLSSEERYKGHDQLLAVWPHVRRQVPDARLVIVGDGDDRLRLEARVVSAGLSDAVRFAGRVSDASLASLYAQAAFFVMPSAREGFGLVYLEAMQAGNACIAVHGAADEIIDDGVQGLVIDPDAPDQLIRALVRLFLDAGARARMGAAAQAKVAAEFTDTKFAARFLATLETIARAASAPDSVRAAGEMTSR